MRASRSLPTRPTSSPAGPSGFGLETARWLVDNGARSLVLAARSRTLTAEAEATLGSLRSGGAAVIVVSADVATRAGVRAALAAVERSGRPLRGIVHAAGTIDDALIEKLVARSDPPRFHRQGARRLAPARADPLGAARFFRRLFLGRGDARLSRPGPLRGGKPHSRCDRRLAPIPGAAGDLDRIRSDRG